MRILLAIAFLLFSLAVPAAQVNEPTDIATVIRILKSSNTALSVPASGNTTLLDLDVRQIDRIFVVVLPTVQNLDAFLVQIQDHPDSAFQTIASSSGDYTSPAGLMVGASGDITTCAAGATCWFILDTKGLHHVKILASANVAGAATVTIFAGGR